MKRCFHVLHGEIRLSPERASTVITVFALLHDLCKQRNIPQPDDDEDEDEDDAEFESAKIPPQLLLPSYCYKR